MRFLLFSSFLILSSCAIQQVERNEGHSCGIKMIFPWDQTMIFHTDLSVMDWDLSGIMILQKEANDKYRFLLTADAGPTLIDMTFSMQGYKRNYIFKKLDRNLLLSLFYEDVSVLIGIHILENKGFTLPDFKGCCYPFNKKKMVCYYSDESLTAQSGATLYDMSKATVTVNYFYDANNLLDSISVIHYNFNMHYKLYPIY